MAPTLTDSDIAYMEAHASDSLAINIIVCCAVCGFASGCFIAARIWSRMLIASRLSWSDWTLITAWLMICNEVLYCFVMGLIKLSLLFLYNSIFPQRQFRWVLWFTAFLIVSWVAYGTLTGILECVPVSALWDTTIAKSYCIDYGTLVVVAGVHNIVLDFIILILPMPLVWRLSMSRQKKFMLVFTFAMGGSAFIVSIVRQTYASKVGSTADSTWDDMPAALVSVAELMAGFLAASIPTYRPLWRYFTADGEKSIPVPDWSSSNNQETGVADRAWISKAKTRTHITTGRGLSSTQQDFGGISVTRDIELSTHHKFQPSSDNGWERGSESDCDAIL
ncbi:hypothetical protein BD289DRAFT_375278 [Coniella lustricola]|uniref:Rhodopsin domain-containing protein n=1 Tax=Coniella lustricola TaxID=2025994 RepID=A0A2T2ZYK1_9PEZI|nr:hypothetical protein BD289DRAFT_375278 [Coniella lustricola]